MVNHDIRPGEVVAAIDPASARQDAGLVFIGQVRTPWCDPASCPKNLSEARTRGGTATIVLDEAWRQGLEGLETGARMIVLYWMDRARRDLIVQHPRHRGEPRGVFLLRSPLRPNPIALAVVEVLALDQAEGRVEIDAIDCLDGTPVLDLKPYLPRVDAALSGCE